MGKREKRNPSANKLQRQKINMMSNGNVTSTLVSAEISSRQSTAVSNHPARIGSSTGISTSKT